VSSYRIFSQKCGIIDSPLDSAMGCCIWRCLFF